MKTEFKEAQEEATPAGTTASAVLVEIPYGTRDLTRAGVSNHKDADQEEKMMVQYTTGWTASEQDQTSFNLTSSVAAGLKCCSFSVEMGMGIDTMHSETVTTYQTVDKTFTFPAGMCTVYYTWQIKLDGQPLCISNEGSEDYVVITRESMDEVRQAKAEMEEQARQEGTVLTVNKLVPPGDGFRFQSVGANGDQGKIWTRTWVNEGKKKKGCYFTTQGGSKNNDQVFIAEPVYAKDEPDKKLENTYRFRLDSKSNYDGKNYLTMDVSGEVFNKPGKSERGEVQLILEKRGQPWGSSQIFEIIPTGKDDIFFLQSMFDNTWVTNNGEAKATNSPPGATNPKHQHGVQMRQRTQVGKNELRLVDAGDY